MTKDFDAVFAQLRTIMLEAGAGQTVATDEPGNLVLRSQCIDPKTGAPGWFGTVTIKKSYVAYHLIPLYQDTELSGSVSEQLAKRRQGKTCFNFKTVDLTLFEELADLTRRANAKGE
ncbi:hypothetical protein [Allosphingosinicella indica]|uniref:DUF1801 domain-containing protein n=1 Tax=Allosphingosinicella indica TaxID=941907 RepID=A0A1X7G0L4_9SPHN|nr:hypothetical protein [Allosphingosinicella indica]SMF61413.1 hypothetical protein SAMN06295910_0401 [Allosphingosinicella indica]